MCEDKLIHAIATRGPMFKILKNCTFTPFKKAFSLLIPSIFFIVIEKYIQRGLKSTSAILKSAILCSCPLKFYTEVLISTE